MGTTRLKHILFGPSARVLGWVIVWLAIFDLGVSLSFGSRAGSKTSLGRYFEYGRSVEGKLERSMAADPKSEGQILSAGWLSQEELRQRPSRPADGTDLLVAVYGQSFAMHAAHEAAAIDKRITIRGIGGPAAPPSHSYAGYKADVENRKADVVVFGILSASVPDMGSMSGLIWHFENPAPFTFPRYRVQAGQLTEEQPVIRTEAQFKQAFSTRSAEWDRFKAQLRTSDRGYDRFTFEQSPADASSIVRLVRRGWVAHDDGYERGVYDPQRGFDPQSEDLQALKAMLADLGERTRARGERLIVLLMHAKGQSDHLHAALAPSLEQAGIEFISTHAIFSANDPTNFLPDSHYVPAVNHRLAQALAERIRRPAPVR
ncbi:hypothetical protein [Piscinibacter sp. HJYY11]|uniref:hypothetical protein n=1 Tax=Piscinibacter sp. HJYY11 TaxID=2801333 RepID=UPI00191D6FFE|nr:hypothetical protein [Piscinibacter sp. HJYY11]MBL0730291.1 hypothetical protein [Piscinibacter sp. HJYY11]